jgi:1-acyl-sn-glycerol-3-phosphate acyltransferase
MRGSLRSQLNRVIVGISLLVVLPGVVVAEGCRRGSGRRLARNAVRVIAAACGVRFEVRGRERGATGGRLVFVPNHSSLLDVPAMLVACPGARFLAAAELFDRRLLGRAMHALGALPIDRRDSTTARRQLDAAAAGGTELCLVVFAEGGIAPLGTRLPFKTGAFALAIAASASVVPVAIVGTGELLAPGGRLAVRPGTIVVDLLEPIPTAGLDVRARKRLRDRTEAAVLDALVAPCG